MADDENLFQDNVDDLPQVDPTKDYFSELVGEGKRYKTPQDLARSKMEGDNYIKTVVRQKDEYGKDILLLREELNKRDSVEALLDQLRDKQASSELPQANDAQNTPSIDLKDVEKLVASKIAETESLKKQQENLRIVKAKLTEQFGSNYQAALKRHTDELGLTEDFVQDLARKHPQVLFKTLGFDQQSQDENFQAPPKTRDRRNDGFAPQVQKRTWSYYQNLKKTDPKTYLDPKTQVQMHEDYVKLGPAFEDGDFKA